MNNAKKNIKRAMIVIFAAFLFPLASFAQFDFDDMNSENIYQVDLPDLDIRPKSVSEAAGENKAGVSLPVKEWTIMTYVNAKSDLESYGLEDVNEMEQVGSTDKINIVVEIGRMNGQEDDTRIDGDWTGTRRLYIQKDNDTSRITSPVAQDLGKTNMGDWREVIKFVKWAKAKYPAKHYMLVIWGHGDGWFKGNPVVGKSISNDHGTGNNIDTPQLGKILAKVGKLDIYASDACLMQMASVVYEIGDSVDYIIGSEEIEHKSGYSFNKFLAALKSNPYMSSFELSKKVVSSYVSILSICALSVIDAEKTKYLPMFTDKFVNAVMKADLKKEVKAARDAAYKYGSANVSKDMCDFVRRVVASTSNTDVKFAGRELIDFIKKDLVVYNNMWISLIRSHGLAIYLPKEIYSNAYEELKWANDSKWDEFIKWSMGII